MRLVQRESYFQGQQPAHRSQRLFREAMRAGLLVTPARCGLRMDLGTCMHGALSCDGGCVAEDVEMVIVVVRCGDMCFGYGIHYL